ncbi:MAG: pyridoxamine 5'-phosphate oxidase family protein [Alphaproteobacteria bacterium]|nr:pyridoxamine 5'-phosphate oxidase family protein [Alphaproteobacteria bacterium]MCZ6765149.1 pyridoxamine 5'-phosphate oxidase family protein [Alphaproteobacteria bacterium]
MADPSPGPVVRALIRGADKASLATRHRSRKGAGTGPRDGWPYGSLVLCATTIEGDPLLLLSDLAEHVKNIRQDDRASLLFDGTGRRADPLSGARASVLGRLRPVKGRARAPLMARFLARHQSAELYAGFADFNLYRMRIEAAHLVAGFGKIHWVSKAQMRLQGIDLGAWRAGEGRLVTRLNGPQSPLVAHALGGRPAKVCSVDPEGLDATIGRRQKRIVFDRPVPSPRGVAAALKRAS